MGDSVNRIVNILLALDCFLFAVCTLGASYPSESFSSAAYRSEGKAQFYGRYARPAIDWVFAMLGQREHCKAAYFSARFNLPEDMR